METHRFGCAQVHSQSKHDLHFVKTPSHAQPLRRQQNLSNAETAVCPTNERKTPSESAIA
jgi:hypothetical protein